jgi:hypothetical protein
MLGIIYIISAHIFKDGIYKVGRSKSFENRLKAYKTSFGTEPIIHMQREVQHDQLIEKLIHIKLIKYRYIDEDNNISNEHYIIDLFELKEKINEIIEYVGYEKLEDFEDQNDEIDNEESSEDEKTNFKNL